MEKKAELGRPSGVWAAEEQEERLGGVSVCGHLGDCSSLVCWKILQTDSWEVGSHGQGW